MSSYSTRSRHGLVALSATLLCTASLALVGAAPASADPVWDVDASHGPTNFAPGGTGEYYVFVRNVGDAAQTGTLTVTTTLPPGTVATATESFITGLGGPWTCAGEGTDTVTCTREDTDGVGPADNIRPPNGHAGFAPVIAITVTAPNAPGVASAEVLVSGGDEGPTLRRATRRRSAARRHRSGSSTGAWSRTSSTARARAPGWSAGPARTRSRCA